MKKSSTSRLFTYSFLIILCTFVNVTSAKAVSSQFPKEKPDSETDSTRVGPAEYAILPGASPSDLPLRGRYDEMRAQRGKVSHPRTKHIRPDGWAMYTNRLFLESSPYLLQHAHNPVNWYPWGDEAFEQARKLNRPVLISIGYSTCHWCHVMEDESFDDEDIARYLNENFIAIKVDREERPDLDSIYMNAVQALTGKGGWPLNVWLTPDRKPFYAGTYLNPNDLMGVLNVVKETYDTEPDRIVEISQKLSDTIRQTLSPEEGQGLPTFGVLHDAARTCQHDFDTENGGLQGAPKFPSGLPVRLLLRYQRRTGNAEFQNMAERTLKKMSTGGMYDQVGGGFHRYSTDDKWLVPHFEKMLYDNALLAVSYLEGYQVTKNKDFERIASETLRYLERDMSSPRGAFYAASDADSLAPNRRREEGYFYTWTKKEIEQVLGNDRAKVVESYYGMTDHGNFDGRNVLFAPQSPAKIDLDLKISEAELKTIIDDSKELLYQARSRRPQPQRDEKILTSWNGLAISAYARAGLILNNHHYIDQAIKAARFILENCYSKGRLFHSYSDGKAKGNAYIEDYSFFIAALLDLFEATYDLHWLESAVKLNEVLISHYEDRQLGGFFMTGDDHEVLLVREKPAFDEAVPSGNSVQVMNLLRLAEFTTNENYRKRAEKALKSFSATLTSEPLVLSEMLLAVDFYLDTPKEVIIVTSKGSKESAFPLLSVLRRQFLPNRIIVVAAEGEELETIAKVIPLIGDKKALKGLATAYVCESKSCRLPTNDTKVFEEQLRSVERVIGDAIK